MGVLTYHYVSLNSQHQTDNEGLGLISKGKIHGVKRMNRLGAGLL